MLDVLDKEMVDYKIPADHLLKLNMRLFVSILFTLLLFTYGFGVNSVEQGKFFLHNFLPEEYAGHHTNGEIVQGKDGLIYVVNILGVLEYDGVRWRKISRFRNANYLSLAVSESGRVFSGCNGNFGFFDKDSSASPTFKSLLASWPDTLTDPGSFKFTVAVDDGIYFGSSKYVFRWQENPDKPEIEITDNTENTDLDFWPIHEDNPLTFMGEINGRIIVHFDGIGLGELVDNRFQTIESSQFLASEKIVAVVPIRDDSFLTVTRKNGIFMSHSSGFTRFHLDDEYLYQSTKVTGCIRLKNGNYALSTHSKGVYLFNQNGEILRKIDVTDGLEDQQVQMSCFQDSQGGLWIPTNYGISRVDISSPLQYFDSNLGIDGSIHSLTRHRNVICTSTSEGVFYLNGSGDKIKPGSFERINGIEGLCSHVYSTGDFLFIAAEEGLFVLQDFKDMPRKILDKHIYYTTLTSDKERLLVGTNGEGVHSFKRISGNWKYEGQVTGDSKSIRRIVSDDKNRYWLTSWTTQGYSIESMTIPDTRILSTSITVFDSTRGLPGNSQREPVIWNNRIYIATIDEGMFYYNEEEDRFIEDAALNRKIFEKGVGIANPSVDEQNRLWYLGNNYLAVMVEQMDEGNKRFSYQLQRAQERIYYNFYSDDDGKTIWAGGEDGRMIKYCESRTGSDDNNLETIIRGVILPGETDEESQVAYLRDTSPVFPYSKNSLRFEYALPSYSVIGSNEYQFRLTGHNDSWSDWTKEAYKDFNSLFEGNYTFEVRGKDIDGNIGETASYNFRINPPFFRAWWSYFIYLLLFIGIIYFVVMLRLRQIGRQKRVLENIVQQRTQDLEKASEMTRGYAKKLEMTLEELKSELIFAERQAAFGQMVQGIVHNLRGPLGTSNGSAELLNITIDKIANKKYLSEDEELTAYRSLSEYIKKNVSLISEANKSMTNTIRSLMVKSRNDQGKNLKKVDLNAFIKTEIIFLLADPNFKNRIKRKINITDTTLIVKVVQGELANVFENLLRNSIDALHNVKDPRMKISSFEDGEFACFSISDNGEGISDKDIQRIFDPFFSTKPSVTDNSAPVGTGLGLWMCKKTIENYGGKIEVKSQEGMGATFTVYLKREKDET